MRFFHRKNIIPKFIIIQNHIFNKNFIKDIKLIDIIDELEDFFLKIDCQQQYDLKNKLVIEVILDNDKVIRFKNDNDIETEDLFDSISCELKN